MRAYLSTDEIALQAEAFADMHEREGGDWQESFASWAGEEGKDFWPLDAHCIAEVARRELIARGYLSPDLEDYSEEMRAA